MSEESKYRPPQLIKDAAKHGELVIFVGAGASKLCGSPNWQEFANQIVSTLESAGKLSFLEAEQLRNLGDARRTLSIAVNLATESETKVPINYDKILHPSVPKPEGVELYRLLAELRPVFVTTNYDKWLHDEPSLDLPELGEGKESEPAAATSKRPRYYLTKDLTPDRLSERGAVLHLHGCYVDPNSMVVSLRDYIKHYANPSVREFLAEMFRNYTVLFVGYGLAELEVLEYIIRSNESLGTGKVEQRHFLLYPHRSTELTQTGFVERFFKDQCGIQVIRYCIDARGYGELNDVFRAWTPQLDVRDPTLLELQNQIDRCVTVGSKTMKDSAIRLVKKNPELTSYFLNSLKDVDWFNDLDDAGFFKTHYSPGVKAINEGGKVLYQADGWPALRYLEHIVSDANAYQASRIAEIVRQVSSDALERSLDNWRTWWSLAVIMSRLPISELSNDDIDMTRHWLLSKFGADMVGQELGTQLLPRLLEDGDEASAAKALLLVDVLSMLRAVEAQ